MSIPMYVFHVSTGTPKRTQIKPVRKLLGLQPQEVVGYSLHHMDDLPRDIFVADMRAVEASMFGNLLGQATHRKQASADITRDH